MHLSCWCDSWTKWVVCKLKEHCHRNFAVFSFIHCWNLFLVPLLIPKMLKWSNRNISNEWVSIDAGTYFGIVKMTLKYRDSVPLKSVGDTGLVSSSVECGQLNCRSFINIFSRKASGFQRQVKLDEQNFFLRETFLKVVKTGKQNQPVHLPNASPYM